MSSKHYKRGKNMYQSVCGINDPGSWTTGKTGITCKRCLKKVESEDNLAESLKSIEEHEQGDNLK